MKTNLLTPTEATPLLQAGEIIAYPTEGVYGLGCDPRNLDAVARLLELKRRPASKGLILAAADQDQFGDYLLDYPTCFRDEITATWPGPVTWLMPVKPEVSPLLRGDFDTLAVRVSAHPVVQALAQTFGHPVISTSANRMGKPPCMTAEEVVQHLGDGVAGVVAGELGGAGKPSEIRSAVDGKIIRS